MAGPLLPGSLLHDSLLPLLVAAGGQLVASPWPSSPAPANLPLPCRHAVFSYTQLPTPAPSVQAAREDFLPDSTAQKEGEVALQWDDGQTQAQPGAQATATVDSRGSRGVCALKKLR